MVILSIALVEALKEHILQRIICQTNPLRSLASGEASDEQEKAVIVVAPKPTQYGTDSCLNLFQTICIQHFTTILVFKLFCFDSLLEALFIFKF